MNEHLALLAATYHVKYSLWKDSLNKLKAETIGAIWSLWYQIYTEKWQGNSKDSIYCFGSLKKKN